ncbi:MAG: UDP-2,3-diacylglucosamine diphosphatase [Alphaproteobacteria bacterium]
MMPDFAAVPTATQNLAAPLTRHFPVLFLSDLHLGSPACREDALHAFLRAHTADTIYLVGDIIDTWVASNANWSPRQHAVLQLLLDRAAAGTRLIFTPGNHDDFFRRYCGQTIAGIQVIQHILHESSNGARYLVIHGDICDVFERNFPRLSRFGARADCAVRSLLGRLNARRRLRGLPDWTLAERVVKRVNDIVRNLDCFDERLAELARLHQADGIICGHFHKPDLHDRHGVAYANCGDWVENSTALAETDSGRLLLLDWAAHGKPAQKVGTHSGFGETAKGI